MLRNQFKIAINMQRCFRMKQAIQSCKEFLRSTRSSIRLQRLWRGYVCRRDLLFAISSIILVQAFARRKLIQKRYQVMKKSSICIQQIWRGFWGELQYQMDLMDIISVQCAVRRKLAARQLRSMRHAVGVLQHSARCYLAHCQLRRKRRAADALTRGHKSAIVCQVRE